jgi:hypothetical protein
MEAGLLCCPSGEGRAWDPAADTLVASSSERSGLERLIAWPSEVHGRGGVPRLQASLPQAKKATSRA